MRLPDTVHAGSLKPATALASGGILLCDTASMLRRLPFFCLSKRKVGKKTTIKGRAFYQDALPLIIPSSYVRNKSDQRWFLHGCQLVNTVPIDFKLPTIPQLPAPERSMSGLELRLCPALCLCKTKFLPSRCRRLLCRRQLFLAARSLQTNMEVHTNS